MQNHQQKRPFLMPRCAVLKHHEAKKVLFHHILSLPDSSYKTDIQSAERPAALP